MQNNITFLLGLVVIFLVNQNSHGQELTLDWKFQTGDKILSAPIVQDKTLYFGSEDGIFYALDVGTQKPKWTFQTRGRIISKATLYEDIVFFESGNVFFALNKTYGKELWRFDPKNALWGYKIDPWDDKRSSAIMHEGVFYVGSSLGALLGLNASTGERVFMTQSVYAQPIRTTPLIQDNVLYFGDWGGNVFAYDLQKKDTVWQRRTYEKKLYDSFGGIASEMTIYKNQLFFGARNHNLQVLNKDNGENIWNYADSTGGWIVGDPVIEQNTLYIGGSDNHKMFAFDLESGTLKWSYDTGLNVYTKPLIIQDQLIFTVGNAYNPKASGKLIVLNKNDGSLSSVFEIPRPSFSSPAFDGTHIYFGAYDGVLYALKWSP